MAVVGNFGLHINKGKHKTKQPNGELISKYKNNPSLIQEMELHQVTSRSKHIMLTTLMYIYHFWAVLQ